MNTLVTAIIKHFNGYELTTEEQHAYQEMEPKFDNVKFDWELFAVMCESDQRRNESWEKIRQRIKKND